MVVARSPSAAAPSSESAGPSSSAVRVVRVYAFRQAIYAVLGAVVAFVASRFDYRVWARQLIIPIFGVTLLLLLAVLTSAAPSSCSVSVWRFAK